MTASSWSVRYGDFSLGGGDVDGGDHPRPQAAVHPHTSRSSQTRAARFLSDPKGQALIDLADRTTTSTSRAVAAAGSLQTILPAPLTSATQVSRAPHQSTKSRSARGRRQGPRYAPRRYR